MDQLCHPIHDRSQVLLQDLFLVADLRGYYLFLAALELIKIEFLMKFSG